MDECPQSYSSNAMDSKVIFNIRGSRFETLKSTLSKAPGEILRDLDEGSGFYDRAKQEYFFDRDPDVFNSVLNMCNTGLIHVPKHICTNLCKVEMAFWGVPTTVISKCCWRTYFQVDEETEVIEHLQENSQQVCDMSQALKFDSFRYKLWTCIEKPGSSLVAKMWYVFYMAAVFVSNVTMCLWTMSDFRTDHYLNTYAPNTFESFENSSVKWARLMLTDPVLSVLAVDTLCMLVFTMEFLVHFFICPRKYLFLKRPINTATLTVIFIMWIGFVMEFNKERMAINKTTRHFFFACKALTMTRLLLFLRLESQFRALRVLLKSIQASLLELMLMILTFAIAALIFGNMLYFIQLEETDGNDSVYIWVWWAIITMTTVGYGDFFPTSLLGYSVGVICAICGVVILSLPIAVISSNFSIYYSLSMEKGRMARLHKHHIRKESLADSNQSG
ncbi:potassium voltage-gated channel subfamily C member 3-like [Mizuhopecten yessoensis]|uniref:Potassium voltage-gated channel protein Shaw n=1 Tax=Mizuhopecten yessoensis TaxID=6573 RepID=A0A210Q5I0_MIZYE|nr:potassium voltage-gated channel subfamily C member 3-like [Mizuhopecten yessoensis]OWF43975.1 Potassium voltage-gated channel protein Shaw [Mizuhopecten yessoensis]